MMYLANDVIQNSRKKGPEFGKEFEESLRKAFEHMSRNGCDEKTKGALGRLLTIWQDRAVYDAEQISAFKKALSESNCNQPSPIHYTDSQQNLQQLVTTIHLLRNRSESRAASRRWRGGRVRAKSHSR